MTLTIKGYEHKGKTAETIAKRLYGRKAVVTTGFERGNMFDFKVKVDGVTVARGIGVRK